MQVPRYYQNKAQWAAVLSLNGVGRVTFQRLLNTLIKHQYQWSDFWVGRGNLWRKLLLNKRAIDGIKSFRKEHNSFSFLEMVNKRGFRVIASFEEDYPKLLLEAADRPPLLYVRSERSLSAVAKIWNQKKPIAFVGTRQKTSYGQLAINKLFRELSGYEISVISGFMYGVDTACHQASLKVGVPTVGVLGFGFDHCYPSHHRYLIPKLLSRGMVFVSEYPPFTRPTKGTFAERNRIIAGMSLGTVVVEAAQKSGSHITAQVALEEGRAVMAVPGPITNRYSLGTKWLLNEGATLVSTGKEILTECLPTRDNRGSNPEGKPLQLSLLPPLQQELYSLLLATPMNEDQLQERLGLSETELIRTLSLMEIDGSIMRSGRKWVADI